jgi:uncharacterized protein
MGRAQAARQPGKRGLDLVDAEQIFRGLHYTYSSSRQGEERWVTIGVLDGREVAVVWTARGDASRVSKGKT